MDCWLVISSACRGRSWQGADQQENVPMSAAALHSKITQEQTVTTRSAGENTKVYSQLLHKVQLCPPSLFSKLWLHSRTVFWAFVWFVDIHYAPAVSSVFRLYIVILSTFHYFKSFCVSFASFYNSDSVFYIDGTWEPCFCEPNTQSRECLPITDKWGHFLFVCLFGFVHKTLFQFHFLE